MRWIIPLVCAAAACHGTPAEPGPPVEPASFEDRVARDPSWQPGDSKAVARDVRRWTDPPHIDEPVQPVWWEPEIRNRCGRAAEFVIGPPVDEPPADAPVHTLQPGEAVRMSLSGAERIYLRDPGGRFSISTPPERFVIFQGDDACDRIWTGATRGQKAQQQRAKPSPSERMGSLHSSPTSSAVAASAPSQWAS